MSIDALENGHKIDSNDEHRSVNFLTQPSPLCTTYYRWTMFEIYHFFFVWAINHLWGVSMRCLNGHVQLAVGTGAYMQLQRYFCFSSLQYIYLFLFLGLNYKHTFFFLFISLSLSLSRFLFICTHISSKFQFGTAHDHSLKSTSAHLNTTTIYIH